MVKNIVVTYSCILKESCNISRQNVFDEDELLDALRDVSWKHGYEGTSSAVIMSVAGLQKDSLYASFGGKGLLYQKAIALYDAQFVSADVKMMRNENLSLRVWIGSLLNGPVDAASIREGHRGGPVV